MKSLFLTRNQAETIADDLSEYLKFKDSSERELFESFEIRFGDLAGSEPQKDEIEIHPKANWLSVEDKNNDD